MDSKAAIMAAKKAQPMVKAFPKAKTAQALANIASGISKPKDEDDKKSGWSRIMSKKAK